MAGKLVTDPALLAQLNAPEPKTVTDPELLQQLNGDTQSETKSPLRQAFEDQPTFIAPPMSKGIAEAALQMGTGLGASILGGLAATGHAAGSAAKEFFLGDKTTTDSADIVRKFQEALTYQPRTEEGKKVSGIVNYPFEKLHEFADWSGNQVNPVMGPEAAAVTSSVIDALPLVLGGGKRTTAPKTAEPPVPVSERVKTVFSEDMKPVERSAVANDVLLSRDIPLTRAQRESHTYAGQQAASGARVADTLLGKSPATHEQMVAFTRALVDEAGGGKRLPTPEVMSDLMAQAETRYARLHEVAPTVVDAPLRAQLADIADKARRVLGERDAAPILNEIEQVYQKATKTPEGEAFAVSRAAADRAAKMRAEDAAARAADRTWAEQQQLQANVTPPAADMGQFAPESRLGGVQGPLTEPVGPPIMEPPQAPRISAVEQLQRRRAAEAQAAADKIAVERDAAQAPAGPEAPNDILQGSAAQDLRTELGRMTRNTGNTPLIPYAKELMNALDDAFERNVTPELKADMADARLRYKRLKQIEAMVSGRPDGVITPRRANQILSQARNRGEYTYGRADQGFADIVRAGMEKLPEKVGDSGTATRGADLWKVHRILTEPVKYGTDLVAAYAARAHNEAGRYRGTPTGTRQQMEANILREKYPAKRELAAAAATQIETPEQRKKRLQAEALRK